MKSLDVIVESNRKKAINLMLDNNVSHISINDNEEFGRDADVPRVLLVKGGETYEADVTDVRLISGNIFIEVADTTDYSSNVPKKNDWYITSRNCLSYSENEVYKAIEYYFDNGLNLNDKIFKLAQEIEQYFRNVLLNEDKIIFTFKDCDIFHTYIGGIERNIKSIYMVDNCVMLQTIVGIRFFLCELGIETECKLLKHFKGCIKDKC